MELFYDNLVFDNRNTDDLFPADSGKTPFFADILKRWASGDLIPNIDYSIITSILVFYPDYVIQNGKTKEFVNLIRDSLLKPDLQSPMNPEKGLYLYTLFFMLLKHGNKEESITVLNKLNNFFVSFCQTGSKVVEKYTATFSSEFSKEISESAFSIFPPRIERAYSEILMRVMETKEILSLKPGFNISLLPGPSAKFNNLAGTTLRSEALDSYTNQDYVKASDIYRKMLVNKFELTGTLVHLARVEMSRDKKSQAEIFIANAFRIRQQARKYVLTRILYFIIFFKMLRSEEFDKWVGCLKYIFVQQGFSMEWDMDLLLAQYEKKISQQNFRLLKALLEVISGRADKEHLNKFKIWQKATSVPLEEWPDFEIVS
jgi:hypothetical protein